MRAAIFSPDGAHRCDASGTFGDDPAAVATALANALLADAPEAIRANFTGAPA
jgi:hydroxymethylbilane synthase